MVHEDEPMTREIKELREGIFPTIGSVTGSNWIPEGCPKRKPTQKGNQYRRRAIPGSEAETARMVKRDRGRWSDAADVMTKETEFLLERV